MKAIQRNIPFEKLDFISNVLKAISHPLRLRIIEILENVDSMNVQDISNNLDNTIEQSLLSHHLIKLKDKGILDCQKSGVHNLYSLKIKEITTILNCMEKCNIQK